MKNFSKLVALLLCLAMTAALFAGCAAPAAEEPAPTEAVAATPAPTAAPTAAPAPAPTAEPAPEATPEPEAKMAPGTYHAEGWGYSLLTPIYVDVTVTEDAITDIVINTNWEDTAENVPILNTVVEYMVPQMIEYQTFNVDAVCGATASSAGVKQAVRAALEAAYTAAGESTSEAAANFTAVIPKSTETITLDTDVLVIGMGGSGSAAAVSASEAAKGKDIRVLAIDKTGKYGGTSANCGEPMGVNPVRFKEKFNNGEDYLDAEAFRAAWIEYTRGDQKTELLDLFLDNSGDTIDWLYFDHEFELNAPLKGFGGNAWVCKYQYAYYYNFDENMPYRQDVTEGTRTMTVMKYFDKFISNFEANGGEYMLNTEAYELITDVNGAVVGVKARSTYDGTEYIINAKKVIMACGGFAGNGEMEEKYFTNTYWPIDAQWRVYGMAQNDGKLMEYAISELGAGTYNIDMPPMVHFKTVPVSMPLEGYERRPIEGKISAFLRTVPVWSVAGSAQNLALNTDTMYVGADGKRFCNEAGTFQFWKSGPTYFAIWGEDRIADIAENGFANATTTTVYTRGSMLTGIPVPEIYDVIDVAVELGVAYKADTVAELAEMLNVPADNLQASIDAYNEACAAGVDEEFGKKAELMIPLGENGPWYAFVGESVVYSTCGGLDVDTQLRVVKADGVTPIENLYAVGNDSMGVLYTPQEAYVTYGGAALGWAFTSGRLAGANAVNALN